MGQGFGVELRRQYLIKWFQAERSMSPRTAWTATENLPERQGCDYLGRRAGGQQEIHLSATLQGSLQIRQCPQETRREERGPGHHLPAHDPGTAHRHARLRPDRRHSQRRLRRLQRRRPAGTGSRTASSKVLITADGYCGAAKSCRSKPMPIRPSKNVPSVKKVIVVNRTGTRRDMQGRKGSLVA